MGYLVADIKPTREELAALMKNSQELAERLKKYVGRKPSANLPELIYPFKYSDPIQFVAGCIRLSSDQFSFGYENELMIAKQVKDIYTYPTGEKLSYYNLTDELTANMSVFVHGFCNVDQKRFYVRENFVTTMLALMDVMKECPDLAGYQEQMKDFDKHIKGIVLAHEHSEMLLRQNIGVGEWVEELVVEEKAREYLKDQKVPASYYELFHKLRANNEIDNISKIVIDEIIRTKATSYSS